MLTLKPYNEVRENFEKIVTDKITDAQKSGISYVYFEHLPDSIRKALEELGYPVELENSWYIVTVL